MKSLLALTLLLPVLVAGAFAEDPVPGTSEPETEAAAGTSGPGLQVAEIRICRDVDRDARAPLDEGGAFPAGVERLYCFTRLVGAADTTQVTHLWLHEGQTRGKVPLPVRSPDWRTWSSKSILPRWTGDWEVRVLDRDGLVLGSAGFRLTAAQNSEDAPSPEEAP